MIIKKGKKKNRKRRSDYSFKDIKLSIWGFSALPFLNNSNQVQSNAPNHNEIHIKLHQITRNQKESPSIPQ